jgi:LPS-assembly lipoprotein
MSSSDVVRPGRGWIGRVAVAIGAAVALSACTVQPLYGPTPAGETVTTALDRIVIDPVETRIAQEVRNRLIFTLGNASQGNAAYRMKLTVTAAESALGVTPIETAPTYSITVAATYEVRSVASDEIVLRGTSRGLASFDRITQVYANTRARLDAENRAAVQAATDIQVRLASAAANGII